MMPFSEQDWWRFCAVLVLIGVGIGFLVFDGLPWLWRVAKPFLRVLVA